MCLAADAWAPVLTPPLARSCSCASPQAAEAGWGPHPAKRKGNVFACAVDSLCAHSTCMCTGCMRAHRTGETAVGEGAGPQMLPKGQQTMKKRCCVLQLPNCTAGWQWCPDYVSMGLSQQTEGACSCGWVHSNSGTCILPAHENLDTHSTGAFSGAWRLLADPQPVFLFDFSQGRPPSCMPDFQSHRRPLAPPRYARSP